MANGSMGEYGSAPSVRCAVYTRKSTEEGLEQEFNSLDAQREAAEAYIQSQRHQGWTLVADRYDDGGFSGANLDRPALKRLLADIQAGGIDCVVVYKVDRLSRSLLDFTRLIDRFDQRSVSFVAVTQQFNTTTSIGRLTLNVLLSFAQYEREIIGERTRDKMSAARKKGKWIGGMPVLGYDVAPEGGHLVVNEPEAIRVREIFQLYEQHRSIPAVLAELERRNWTTKVWNSRRGIRHGGRSFGEPILVRLLTNPAYAGLIRHKGQMYQGEHPAIVAPALWELVNSHLCNQGAGTDRSPRIRRQAFLFGLLYCGSCRKLMMATATAHRGRQYRYYVCRQKQCPVKSVSASAIEESVQAQIRIALERESARQRLGISDHDWQALATGDGLAVLRRVVRQISIEGTTGRVSLELNCLDAVSDHED